jgi:hypothetical protein
VPAYIDIPKGKVPAEANDIQQIVEAWSGRRNIPQSLVTNDPIAYSLTIRNTDPGARTVAIYAADGTTLLFGIDASGVKLSPDGTAATTPVSSSGAILTNPTLINTTLSGTVAGSGLGTGASQVAVGNHTHAHAATTGRTTDDHHNQSHTHNGSDGSGSVDHGTLTSRGTQTHTAIDAHIAALSAHGVTGQVVGTADAQTLSNKTLADPIITSTLTVATGTQALPTATAGRRREYKAWGGSLTITHTSIIPPGQKASQGTVGSYTLQDGESIGFEADGANWWAI